MRPNIYSYTSAIEFFTDSYNVIKKDAESSLRKLSLEMGFQSPNLLMDLLKKKRPLKLKYADNLALGLKLNSQERAYFKAMIQLERASLEERSFLEEILNALRPKEVSLWASEGIYSHWLNVIIFTLGQMSRRPITVKEIQNSLKEAVSHQDIENSLKILLKHGLFQETKEGHYQCTHSGFITTMNDETINSVHDYYRQIISKAQNAVELGVQDREFQCFAVGMKKENLQKVKEIIRNTRQEIASYWDEQGDHIYQFNLNGFPMAEMKRSDNTGLNKESFS